MKFLEGYNLKVFIFQLVLCLIISILGIFEIEFSILKSISWVIFVGIQIHYTRQSFYLGFLNFIFLITNQVYSLVNYPLGLFPSLFFIIILIVKYLEYPRFLFTKESIPIWFIFISTCISTIFATNLAISLPQLISFTIIFAIMLFFIVEINHEEKLTEFWTVFVLSLTVVTINYIITYLFSTTTEHLVFASGAEVYEKRVVSKLLATNEYGIYCASTIPIMYYLYNNKKQKWLYLIILILSVIGIFTTKGRAATIILGVAFLIYIILGQKINLLNKVILLGGIALSYIYIGNVNSDLFNRFKVINEDTSVKVRTDNIGKAIHHFLQSPFIGQGLNSFASVNKINNDEDQELEEDRFANTHNSYLNVLTSLGIIGSICFFYFIIMAFKAYLNPTIHSIKIRKPIFTAIIFYLFGAYFNDMFFNGLFYFLFSSVMLISLLESNKKLKIS